MTISLILAESALEIIPKTIFGHPSVKSHARKTRVHPSYTLLDNSWHYAAMKNLDNFEKRGRPDLVHLAILMATSTPLYNRHNDLNLYVHTVDNNVIHFGSSVRIPKSYHRFVGLIETLYRKRLITVDKTFSHDGDCSGNVLLELKRNQTFADLVSEKKFSKVIGLSSQGRLLSDLPCAYRAVADNLTDGVAIVVGGFQKGHFSNTVATHFHEMYSVDTHSLEAHVVISRLLYEYEIKPFM